MNMAIGIHSELRERGVAKLKGFLPPALGHAARDAVLSLARQHGILSEGEWARSESRFGLPRAFRDALNALGRDGAFPPVLGKSVPAIVEQFVGAEVVALAPGQQVLFSLPIAGSWHIPHDVWHLDLPRLGEDVSPGLQAFTFIDDVEPQGGATVVIAGSHRLFNQSGSLSSKELKRRLEKESYFKTLFDPNRERMVALDQARGYVDGVELEAAELCGQVGDVYLMDLRVLHAPAPNCSNTARMMMTCRYPRKTVAAQLRFQGAYS